MKVLLFNGSPKKEGNTYHCLAKMQEFLNEEQIETEIINIGAMNVKGCTGCGGCFKMKNLKCVIKDEANEVIAKMKDADGFVFGSPVYYAGMTPQLKSFMDRAFYVSGANGNILYHKVGASLVAVRRSGGSATFDDINKFLLYSEMIIPTSNYWNIIHGTTPGEVLQDTEGMQIIERLAKNMAWTLRLVENGKGKVEEPTPDKKTFMNFIR